MYIVSYLNILQVPNKNILLFTIEKKLMENRLSDQLLKCIPCPISSVVNFLIHLEYATSNWLIASINIWEVQHGHLGY